MPATPEPAAPAARTGAEPATGPACRVMSISGVPRSGSGQPIAAREKLVGAQQVELDKGTRMVFKHTDSAREWTLQGPAIAILCTQGREEISLGLGTLTSEMGPGARPGAEVIVGTPFGALGYSDARLEIRVSDRELAVTALAGEAWVSRGRAKDGAKERITGSAKGQRSLRERLTSVTAASRCSDAAKRAETVGALLLAPGQGGLGQRAAEHVRARQAARIACTNAAAAVIAELRGDERERRLLALANDEQIWQRIPAAPR